VESTCSAVITVAALAVIILTGCILALKGPQWWHESGTGLFINSMHLWSVEIFFFAMVVHLWGKFFMAAWRGKRRATWITGVVSFVISIAAAFTGYVSQDKLRLSVDQHPGERWHQLDGRRRVLQRHELRPDADVAHHAAATRRGRPGGRAHLLGTPPGRRAAVRRSAIGGS